MFKLFRIGRQFYEIVRTDYPEVWEEILRIEGNQANYQERIKLYFATATDSLKDKRLTDMKVQATLFRKVAVISLVVTAICIIASSN